MTRQLDLDDDDDLSTLAPPTVRPIVTPPRRRPPKIPDGAAWATQDDFSDEELDTDYEREQADYETGFQEEREGYAAEEAQSTPSYRQGAAAADDFRSRLAAVLGQPAEPGRDDFEEPAPAPKPARSRRVTQAPAPAAEKPKPPARRGRKKAEPAVTPPEVTEEAPAEEGEPDWIRLEDVPRIARATQPGGGFARPDPQGVAPYRPRRPTAAKPPAPDDPAKAVAPRRRSTTATPKAAAAKPGAAKTSSPKSSASGVSPASPDKPESDAPKPRRGRPPKPKP